MERKLRLLKLGKQQTDLLTELRKRGFPRLSYALLNDYINEKRKGKQMCDVLNECDNIIKTWEVTK